MKKAQKEMKVEKEVWRKLKSFISLGLIVILLIAGVRQSDLAVAKLFFVPWPIYSDYVFPPDVEKVDFLSLDGTKLNAWFFHGKSPKAKKRPVLLYVHGNAGNLAAQYFQFSFISDWGYDVLAFDYRGFGFSRGRPGRVGMWKDTQAAFNYLTEKEPGRKYGIVGFSMGSSYALMLATQEPRVSAAVIMAPFNTFRDIGVYTLKAWGVPAWCAPFLGWLLIPGGIEPIGALHAEHLPPALFAHGTWDGNIPYSMGQEMAMNYAGPKFFLTMQDYSHGDYFKGPMGETFHKAFDRLFLEGEVAP